MKGTIQHAAQDAFLASAFLLVAVACQTKTLQPSLSKGLAWIKQQSAVNKVAVFFQQYPTLVQSFNYVSAQAIKGIGWASGSPARLALTGGALVCSGVTTYVTKQTRGEAEMRWVARPDDLDSDLID